MLNSSLNAPHRHTQNHLWPNIRESLIQSSWHRNLTTTSPLSPLNCQPHTSTADFSATSNLRLMLCLAQMGVCRVLMPYGAFICQRCFPYCPDSTPCSTTPNFSCGLLETSTQICQIQLRKPLGRKISEDLWWSQDLKTESLIPGPVSFLLCQPRARKI